MIAKVATWEGRASYTKMSDLCQWDCTWYAMVLNSGYDKVARHNSGESNWPFHPLFPMTAYPLKYWLRLSTFGSLVLASKVELLLAIYAFLLLLSDRTKDAADRFRAGSLVAFNPYVIYAHAGYAEPLYFALIALAFLFAERHRWVLSGGMGGLASATRLVGMVFAASYCIIWGRSLKGDLSSHKLSFNGIIGLLLCPLGTALFMLYMYHHIGDALVQQHIQVAWGKIPGNPFQVLWMSFLSHHWPFVWGVTGLVALLLSGWLVYLHKPEHGVFLAASVLIPFSATWMGAPRYIWWQPPFLYVIYLLLKRNTGLWLIYTAFASGIATFVIVEWFSGHPFVI